MLLCQHPSNQGQCRNLKCHYAAMGKRLASLAKDYYSCCYSAQRARPYVLDALHISRQNILWIFTTWTTKQELGSCKRTLQQGLFRVSRAPLAGRSAARDHVPYFSSTWTPFDQDSACLLMFDFASLNYSTYMRYYSIPCCYSSYIRRRKWPLKISNFWRTCIRTLISYFLSL